MSEEFEELMDLPQEWINILERMPEVREDFIEDKEEDEMIPIYFFSYFEDDYKECEPFFTCFERGIDVFNNFYSIYGSSDAEDNNESLDNEQIIELVKKHIEGMKYMLELNNSNIYDFDNMKIKLMSKEEYIQNGDLIKDNEEDDNLRSECVGSMLDNILPEEEENPISAFHEALYEQTQNYYVLYYILWPLGKMDNIDNPFEAYEKLWENNIEIHLLDKELMVAVK